jgi:hypothetical protein
VGLERGAAAEKAKVIKFDRFESWLWFSFVRRIVLSLYLSLTFHLELNE